MSRVRKESTPGRRDGTLGLNVSGRVRSKFFYFKRNAGKKHDFYIQ